MDEQNKDLELTPEERTAEEEAQKEVNEDELRDKLAEDYGIDAEKQPELLNKLVEREKLNRQRLSGAIKQKISWREKAQKPSETPKGNAGGQGKSQSKETPDIDALFEQKFNERMEARDLEALGLPDDLRTEVKDLAKIKGISVREAANLPYIKSRKEEIERTERIKNATPTRSGRGSNTVVVDPSKPLNPDDFKTSDGNIDVKAWNEAKAQRARHRNSS